ncbi:glycogen debranching protein [Pseudoxanthomonas dokdonensis]|uniref:Isoamylase n=1 Tax=Pseudoxanthomonas dokdonensis TaxID=344882 RepID=A0A0R0D2T2_9GAMM|nr:isoamylase [Pseudoxanthomonas dokdonensis]KRG71688.1 isoamylase [Pseudoxanthomonas dokdonensis]
METSTRLKQRRWPATLLLACMLGAAGSASAAINQENLGARYLDNGRISFRVFSANATRIELELYKDYKDAEPVATFVMEKNNDTRNIWRQSISVQAIRERWGIKGPIYYGYRAWGPNWPYQPGWRKGSQIGFISDVDADGNRFNPNKLLLDPYALETRRDPLYDQCRDGTLLASGPEHRAKDSAACAPKGLVLEPDNTPTGDKPQRPFRDEIIYEVNVRGFTMDDPSVPKELRGTYAGAALKAEYLASLGVTAVEFLPVQETQNETNHLEASTDGDNYWGYSTLNYFSPDRRYSAARLTPRTSGEVRKEWKNMVKAFHDAGIKVYIDVVYNHTGEGGAWGGSDGRSTYNIMSWRGLDNATYYSLTDDHQYSWDNTGVGGNYNSYNPIAQNLIIDSLAYWRDEMGVDGFRFDLASVLGNTCEHGCFNYDRDNPNTALNRIAAEIAPRGINGGPGVDLIAEPWAIGGNSYQVGNFPQGWVEWNDKYRDAVRTDQNRLGVIPLTLGELATRLAGSYDLYQDDGRRPWNSVNFVVAHDGFTLNDLYSYNDKQNNQPWPYGPSDGGTDNNLSWDHAGNGAEQRKAARTGMALLMLSAGVPMMTGGDEGLRTVFGNNNPYNLDSSANYLHWTRDQFEGYQQVFTERLLAFRRNHPSLRPSDYYSGADNNGNVLEQLRWFRPDGAQADPAYFENPDNHAIAWRIDGSEFGDPVGSDTVYVAYNGWQGDVEFNLPWPGPGKQWYRVMDTASWNEGLDSIVEPGSEVLIGGENTRYGLQSRSVLLLIAR